MNLSVEISPGELIDKITILEIKAERIQGADKRKHIATELDILRNVYTENIKNSEKMGELTTRLRSVNESLWDIEDDIRICEKNKDFGESFIELARSVYKCNDQRAEIKREMNELLSSRIFEVKSYEDY